MATIIAYVITIGCVLFTVTSIIQMLIGGLIGRFSNAMIGAFIGSVITWMLINFLWVKYEGGQIPILALLLSIGTLFLYGSFQNKELNQNAKTLMAAEI